MVSCDGISFRVSKPSSLLCPIVSLPVPNSTLSCTGRADSLYHVYQQ